MAGRPFSFLSDRPVLPSDSPRRSTRIPRRLINVSVARPLATGTRALLHRCGPGERAGPISENREKQIVKYV